MGDCNSGWRRAKRATVEDCDASLIASQWQREGILDAGEFTTGFLQWTFRGQFTVEYDADAMDPARASVRLRYIRGGALRYIRGGELPYLREGEPAQPPPDFLDYVVQLTTTRPQFGGLRWWFICPLIVDGNLCGRRVGKLHLPPEYRYFGCRHCYRLTYASCQRSRKPDAMLRHIAKRVGIHPLEAQRLLRQPPR